MQFVKMFLFINLLFFANTLYSQERSKLSDNINSACIEVNPVVSLDGQTLYFCRSDCENNLGGDDIWVSRRDSKGNWGKAYNIGQPLNDKANNFVCSISGDGNELLLGNIYRNRHKSSQGVSVSRRVDGGWSFPDNQEIADFYNLDESNSFWLSYDSKYLLMTVKRSDSHGGKDIYFSKKISENNWSKPINLGTVINSAGDEITPYLAADSRTLYFSSNGHKGYGDMDVFVTRRLDNSWTNWSVPINLGDKINTPNWDAYYKLSAKADVAYYVIATSTENTDIYQVTLDEDFKPFPVTLVSGAVISSKSFVPINSIITYKNMLTNEIMGEINSSIVDGAFSFVVPVEDAYIIEVQSDAYNTVIDTLDLRNIYTNSEIIKYYTLVPRVDSVFHIKNMLLQTGKSEPTLRDIEIFKNIVNFLKENPGYKLEIVGHTDSVGTDDDNFKLSKQRAEKSAELLIRYGLNREFIILTAKGESEPIAPNSTPEGRKLNRRVEFYMKKD